MSDIDVSTVFTDSAPTLGQLANEKNKVTGFVADPFNSNPNASLSDAQIQNFARKAIDVLGISADEPFTTEVLDQLRRYYRVTGRSASFGIIDAARKMAATAAFQPDAPMTDGQNDQRIQWLQVLSGVADFGPSQSEINARVKNPTPVVAALLPRLVNDLLDCRTQADWQSVRGSLHGLFGDFRYQKRTSSERSERSDSGMDGWSSAASESTEGYDPEDD